jgi:hypothetical protein
MVRTVDKRGAEAKTPDSVGDRWNSEVTPGKIRPIVNLKTAKRT